MCGKGVWAAGTFHVKASGVISQEHDRWSCSGIIANPDRSWDYSPSGFLVHPCILLHILVVTGKLTLSLP